MMWHVICVTLNNITKNLKKKPSRYSPDYFYQAFHTHIFLITFQKNEPFLWFVLAFPKREIKVVSETKKNKYQNIFYEQRNL